MNKRKLEEHGVLFVDDEIQVLKAIKRGLHLEKYNKFFANSGGEALEIIRNEKISLIITDMKMPHMDGLELLKRVNDINPNIVKIILSGYTNIAQIIATINALNIYKFILKPWDINTELKPSIIEALKRYNENVDRKFDIESANKKNELFKKLVNENKRSFSGLKEDFESITKLNKMALNYAYFLSLQLKKGSISETTLKEELNFIEKINFDFISKLPSNRKKLDLKLINNIISQFLKKEYYHQYKEIFPNFKINSEKKEYDNININFDCLMILVKLILKDFFELKYDSRIDMIVKENNDNDEKIVLLFKVDNDFVKNNKTRLNTIYIVANALANTLGGKFQIASNEKSKNIVILELSV